jgi:hypothetical protein
MRKLEVNANDWLDSNPYVFWNYVNRQLVEAGFDTSRYIAQITDTATQNLIFTQEE